MHTPSAVIHTHTTLSGNYKAHHKQLLIGFNPGTSGVCFVYIIFWMLKCVSGCLEFEFRGRVSRSHDEDSSKIRSLVRTSSISEDMSQMCSPRRNLENGFLNLRVKEGYSIALPRQFP